MKKKSMWLLASLGICCLLVIPLYAALGNNDKSARFFIPCFPAKYEGEVYVYANPEDCNLYYECDNGVLRTRNCPQGHYFCSEKGECTWEWDAQCAFSDCIKK